MDVDEDFFGDDNWDPQAIEAIDEAVSSQMIRDTPSITEQINLSQMSTSTYASADHEVIRLQQMLDQMKIDLRKQQTQNKYKDIELD
ncbi:unnamed protein product [Rhizopus stolonifer]